MRLCPLKKISFVFSAKEKYTTSKGLFCKDYNKSQKKSRRLRYRMHSKSIMLSVYMTFYHSCLEGIRRTLEIQPQAKNFSYLYSRFFSYIFGVRLPLCDDLSFYNDGFKRLWCEVKTSLTIFCCKKCIGLH